MAGIKHAFTSAVDDSDDDSLVQATEWNADHSITGAVDFGSYTHTADVINESTADAGVTLESVAHEDGAITATSLNLGDETMDAYESGQSWTPVLTFATPGDVSVSYNTQTAEYEVVGDIVTATFDIVTSAFTHTTASGYLRVTGLPFSAAGVFYGEVYADGWSLSTRSLSSITTTGQTYLVFGHSASGLNAGKITTSSVASGGTPEWHGTIVYRRT